MVKCQNPKHKGRNNFKKESIAYIWIKGKSRKVCQKCFKSIREIRKYEKKYDRKAWWVK